MAVTGLLKVVLVNVILLWVAGDTLLASGDFSHGHDNLDEIVVENFVIFLPLMKLAYEYQIPEADQTIANYLYNIHDECYSHHNYKAAADIREYIEELKVKFREGFDKVKAKTTIKFLTTQLVPKLILRYGQKVALNILFDAATNPWGYAADGAQMLLEVTGYDTAGKVVGAGGNILAGAISGYVIGGPPGAVLGGLFGFSFWGVGELACYEDVKEIEKFIERIIE